MYKH